MTQDTVTRPPAPEAPGKNFVYVAVPAQGWRVAKEDTLCRYRPGARYISCDKPAVAEKEFPNDAIYPWWGYCPEHAATLHHWVEDGTVMTWALRKPGRESIPLTAEEVARALGGVSGWCTQHKRPKSECAPWDRHNRSIRFRKDDLGTAEQAARVAGLDSASEYVVRGMEAMQGFLRCGRGRCATDGPPVPVTWGDLTGKTLGEWIAEAVGVVEDQHPRHEPVMIGAEPPAVTR